MKIVAAAFLTANALCVFPPRIAFAQQNTAAITQVRPDFIVASDGSGHFVTVQQAVNAAPNESDKRTVILIKPGVYQAPVVVPATKTHLQFVGEDAEKTIITSALNVRSIGADGKEVGTRRCSTVVVSASNFEAHNLTFENTSPHVAQALAIYLEGDCAIFRNCRFVGWQDTVRVRRGRSYFEGCFILGRTDFIYGEATAFFSRCHIHALERGWITAANTPADQPFGLVFSGCKITVEPGVQTLLGRPWRPFASTVWLDTQMEGIALAGWNNWNKPEAEKTVRPCEFNSRTPDGKPVDLSGRVAWSKI